MSETEGDGSLRRRRWPVALVLVVGLALSLVAFWAVKNANHDRLVLRFESAVASLERSARRSIERDLEVLFSLRDAYQAQGGLSRQEFAVFAGRQLSRHPDFRALEWVPEVTAAERPAYEASARRDGLAGFRLTEAGPGDSLVAVGPRDVYYPVYYVEPFAGNERALGYAPVLATRDEAIAQARDTGRPAATQGFAIVQSAEGHIGVAIFVPVYEGASAPDTVAGRRAQLEGLMEGVILPADALASLVDDARSLGITLALTDTSAPPGERELIPRPTPPEPAVLHRDVPIDMGTRKWVLSFWLAEESLLRGTGGTEWLVLLAGLAATGIFSGYLQLQQERRNHAERLLVERTRSLEQAQALERMKNNFVSSVSHDLRTPLTSIKGYAEFLEDEIGGALSAEQQDFVKQIERNTDRLEHLVDDLLDFARLDAGTFRLRRESVDLVAKVHDVARGLGPLVADARLSLEVPEAAEPVEASMDAARIERVLFNLIHNAIKFSAPGGAIRVRVAEDADSVRCEVEDTGPGISKEQVAKLFQRFSQLKEGSEKGGTGLGLSIVKAIVEAHGGTIGVVSEPGQGSTFWFTLPKA